MKLNKIWLDIYASRQSNKILTGTLAAVETFTSKKGVKIECGIVFLEDAKILIPITEMNITMRTAEDLAERAKKRNEAKNDETEVTITNRDVEKANRSIIRSMIGAEIDFVIEEMDVDNKIARASRKKAMAIRRTLELKRHNVGDKILVRVTSTGRDIITVDAYGIETKISKDDIDWGYVDEISNYVQVGDKVQALIKEINADDNHIVVSIKEAKEDPYETLINSLEKGGEYLAAVTGVKEYGVFLKIRAGINALCPHPNWSNFNPTVGDKFVIRIKNIDHKNRKIDANLIRPVSKAI